MENFRDFEIGPDPFGQTWQAHFKYLQTGISIRHSNSVDVRYVLDSGSSQIQKTIVIQNADIRAYATRTGRKVSDAWCSRIAMCKLRYVIETAEDLEKGYLQSDRPRDRRIRFVDQEVGRRVGQETRRVRSKALPVTLEAANEIFSAPVRRIAVHYVVRHGASAGC